MRKFLKVLCFFVYSAALLVVGYDLPLGEEVEQYNVRLLVHPQKGDVMIVLNDEYTALFPEGCKVYKGGIGL